MQREKRRVETLVEEVATTILEPVISQCMDLLAGLLRVSKLANSLLSQSGFVKRDRLQQIGRETAGPDAGPRGAEQLKEGSGAENVQIVLV